MFSEKEYKEIFELYYVPLCYYVRKYGLDHYESEEVVQQVFLKIWERREKFLLEKSIQPYLYQAVKNEGINHLKQKKVFAKNKEEYTLKIKEAEFFSELSEEDGTSALLANELEQHVNDAIEKLPEKCKEIFILSRKEYLTMKDIAERLDISVNTVQKQISIAIFKLKDMLKYYITVLLIFVGHFF